VWFEFQMALTNTATPPRTHVPNCNAQYFAVCYHCTVRHRDFISENPALLNLFCLFASFPHANPTNSSNRSRQTAVRNIFRQFQDLHRPGINISVPYDNSRDSNLGLKQSPSTSESRSGRAV
jgi:hypothetical protein